MRYINGFKPAIFILLLILILLLSNNVFAANETLVFDLKMHRPLELAPYNTQLLFENGQLSALSIIKGKILYFKEIGANWIELQRFGPHDINFTTFQVKDLNGDNMPEIIAGTEDPGLIYLYTWENSQWSLLTYGKHVWSTINKIIIGNFSKVGAQEILVQNDEGFLFLLNSSLNSVDLVWKSPNIWRPINDAVVVDIDNDLIDEIVVVYRAGGIAVLKVENNAVVSIWENYPWGKILGLTVGDWDNDQQLEAIFSTSQKLLYVLGKNENQFYYEGQFSDFDYIIEKLSFYDNQDYKVLITTDTAGQLKAFQFNSSNRKWAEKMSKDIGRIRQIIQPHSEQALFWCSNRNVIELAAYKLVSLRFKFADEQCQLNPNALYYNDQIYISPRAVSGFFGFAVSDNEESQTFSIITNERTIEISKNELNLVSIGGLSKITLPIAPIIFNNELYFTLDTFRSLLNISLIYNPEEQTITPF